MSDVMRRVERDGRTSECLAFAGVLALAASMSSMHAQAQYAERSGEQIVQAQCFKCHESGKGGAPRIGDRTAWIPRVKQGLDAVVRSAIRGHGTMPARGGMADLTDAELRSAVVYMFNKGAGSKE
ncbi:MAG: cytochrome c5 family protein [Betaproteobacteria bacterium]|nr:cytochrome c5 family protein [Betaproteobacteria bacterium]